ncbi:hypothetical protein TVAG_083960 [Trichomonas vaginalis G3]|uniref:Uncharacterized protein n=1 Tax=Trichomonas vaginalis (strain ATCC PRA-98 / G3) TaxID=412133 RepID=A2DMC0_TRIV3|nr:hypothetical protein TVAG_083960 [Trichomonas vaginalis G3]|eukprot:XP_001579526.1 hypothetical protein [Trichomonas vaginalis G3]
MYRQVPLTVAFSSENENVKINGNRITFKLPIDWSVNINEKYIGLSNMYITRGFRKVEFELEVVVINETQEFKQTIHIYKYFKDDTTLYECMNDFNEIFEKKFNKNALGLNVYLDKLGEEGIHPQIIDFHYEFIEQIDDSHTCTFAIYSPFNEVAEKRQSDFRIGFKISQYNEDFMNVFNYKPGEERTVLSPIITYNVWDRKQVILYSNIAKGVENEFIGHTRASPLTNIKYYKLSGNNREFWIDMYSTHDHKCPIVLPEDRKDVFFLEAQLMNSTIATL